MITEKFGHGLMVDAGDGTNTTYVRLYARGNIIAGNDGSGVYVVDVDEAQSGSLHLLNNTIVGNGDYGIEFDVESLKSFLGYVQNCIVRDNGLGSSANWDPCSDAFWNGSYYGFNHNVWEGDSGCVASGCTPDSGDFFNMDVDPGFVNAAAGDYHIDSGSCCIDRGVNTPLSTNTQGFRLDIDGQPRRADGDDNGSVVTDIGADERPDPTPGP